MLAETGLTMRNVYCGTLFPLLIISFPTVSNLIQLVPKPGSKFACRVLVYVTVVIQDGASSPQDELPYRRTNPRTRDPARVSYFIQHIMGVSQITSYKTELKLLPARMDEVRNLDMWYPMEWATVGSLKGLCSQR